jgi:hypothetical protein
MSPTIIGGPAMAALRCHVTDEYMGLVKVKMDGPYIHQFSSQTNEYNLNIYVSTDEYIITDE